MGTRRIGLLAAAASVCVLSIGAGVALWGPRQPVAVDMHRRYRVELDRPPVEVALWFADQFPEYFRSGEVGLGPWLDSLDPRDRDFVLALAQTSTWTWVELELGVDGFDESDPEAIALAASAAVRDKTLNQLELDVEDFHEVDAIEFASSVDQPEFAAGAFARLVRGVSNCEGQNHLVAILLDEALDARRWVSPVETRMLSVQIPAGPDDEVDAGHELVRVDGPGLGQPMFVDAWSNLPPFCLDPTRPHAAALLTELGPSPRPVVAGVPGRPPLPAANYLEVRAVEVAPLVARDAPSKAVDLVIRPPDLDPAALAREHDIWKLYLYARILHIYDDPRAAELYQLVRARDCGEFPDRPRTFFCAAATQLLARVR